MLNPHRYASLMRSRHLISNTPFQLVFHPRKWAYHDNPVRELIKSKGGKQSKKTPPPLNLVDLVICHPQLLNFFASSLKEWNILCRWQSCLVDGISVFRACFCCLSNTKMNWTIFHWSPTSKHLFHIYWATPPFIDPSKTQEIQKSLFWPFRMTPTTGRISIYNGATEISYVF